MITMLQVIELKVHLHCKSCEKSIRKALCNIKGVTCVEINAISNKITVMGYVDRKVVVKAVWKTGRRAEPWKPSCRPREEPRLHGFRCIIPKWVLS